jgi:surface protein
MIGIGIGLVGGGIVNQLPFRFTVNTNNTSAGSSTSTQFKLPLVSSGTLNAVVDWGDGTSSTITTWNQAEVTHTYATAGVYDIKITGVLRGWQFNNGGDRLKILNIINWSGLNISVSNGFTGCTNLTASATDAPVITSTSLFSYFDSCNNFNGEIGNWNVSNVTNLGSMFQTARAFNKNIGSWNTANVTNMSSMFNLANSFNNGGSNSISSWDTSKVTNMANMFKECFFGTPNISSWDTSKVTNMSGMFDYCQNNSNFGSWDVSNVTNMSLMFRNNFAFNQNIGSWNVSNVTSFESMFSNATAFNNGGSADINNWTIRTASAVSMGSMFRSSSFNQNISSWNTSAVTNMSAMFSLNGAFNQPIGSWNTSAVTDMNNMFSTSNFNQNIGAWNVSNVTSFTNMFGANYSFNNGGSSDINNWTIKNTGTVSMAGMFGDSTFNQPIGNWNTSAVTNMSLMFRFNTTFNQNIGNWNVSNVTNFSSFMDGKSAANYSAANLNAIYNGWSSRPVQPNLSIGFGTIKYTVEGQAGKNILDFAPNNWTIVDGGI